MTTELVATRQTIEQLPTRPEVDARIVEERIQRKRSFRWLYLFVALQSLALTGLVVLLTDTHAIVGKVEGLSETNVSINRATLDTAEKIDCVVAAASTQTGEELQMAYARCLQLVDGKKEGD